MKSFMGRYFTVSFDDVENLPVRGRLCQRWLTSRDGFYFLVIGEHHGPERVIYWTGTCGLLVQKINGKRYKRAGYWQAEGGFVAQHTGAVCNFQPETIIII